MSRVSWLWGSRPAKSFVEEDEAEDDVLQSQLNADMTMSQDVSQNSPLLQKKKRKSRETSGDGENPRKRKRQKKRRKSQQHSVDDDGELDRALTSVLAHLDESVGHKSPLSGDNHSGPKTDGSVKLNGANGNLRAEVSDTSGEELAATIQSAKAKAFSTVLPKKDPLHSSNGSTPSGNNRRSSLAASPALLATIMKTRTSGSSTIGKPSSESPILPPKRVAIPAMRQTTMSTPLEIPKSSEPKNSTTKESIHVYTSPKVTAETSPKPGGEFELEPEPEPTVQKSASAKPERASVKEKSTSKRRVSRVSKWKIASMKATIPEGWKIGPPHEKKRCHCPVDICDKAFSRKTTMGQHMNIVHARATYQDNGDGTLSIVGMAGENNSDSASDSDGSFVPKSLPPRLHNGETSAKDDEEFNSEPGSAPPPAKRKKPISVRTQPTDRRSRSQNMIEQQTFTPPVNKKPAPGNILSIDRYSRSGSIMEPWELKPGRIRGSVPRSDNSVDNIAFSSAYINSNNHGVKFNTVQFTVVHLPGGATHRWTSDGVILRICSVAAGKVNVVLGSREFSIGPNGMWRIREGEICEVANQNYGEAVIHVSRVDE